ncbi:MAG: hypothetical protein JW776_04940 [Candidatus Lokiarchaeota archaeon]|nr:hypothetical protein [Candidatus Lokiarchaeota archaeon]
MASKEYHQVIYRYLKMAIALFSILIIATLIILVSIEWKRPILADPTEIQVIIFILTLLISLFLAIFSVIEIREYVSYFRNLRNDLNYHNHRLTYNQVIDNENRKLIIEIVIEESGIHYNALRKKSCLSPGQFRHHLTILLHYGIIQKLRHGQNLLFFPVGDENKSDFDFLLKFPLRESIFKLIKENPGIIASEIARNLNMPQQRNKIKYHIDKLIAGGYIISIQHGNQKGLYINDSTSSQQV